MPMEYRPYNETSYQRALQNTFATTYGTSYRTVDTLHKSPVYTERDFYSVPPVPTTKYQRESYPYQEQPQLSRDQYVEDRPGPWKGFYDYDKDHDWYFGPPQTDRGYYQNGPEQEHVRKPLNDVTDKYEENATRPIEKKSCHSCREPEAYAPKNTNQLRCNHKFCDNCITYLYTTIERFGDVSAKYFHCGICPSSKTPGPTIIRFDPFGRRVVPLPYKMQVNDAVKKRYNDILANPEQENEKHHDKPFCHGCFNTNECVNQLGCHHRYCDVCFNKLHCTDNPFRYSTCLHYFCNICDTKTPEMKVIRFDPYGRRLLKFHDVRYYN